MVWTEEYDALYFRSASIRPIKGNYYNYFIHELAMRLNRGESPSVIFVGNQGMGKSEKALRLVEILQEELNMFKGEFSEEQLVYDPLNFLEQLMDIETPDPDADQNVHEDRRAMIFDEAGINLNVADYHSDMNKSVDEVIQTMRILNSLYIFCVPQYSSIDSRIQREADIIVKVEEQGRATPILIEKDHTAMKKSDAFRKIGLYKHKWRPDRPSEENRKIYKNKEVPFKLGNLETLYEDMKKEREELEEKGMMEQLMES